MLVLSNDILNNDNSRFWAKDMRRRRRTPTVILASRAVPPQAAGSKKSKAFRIMFAVKNYESYNHAEAVGINAKDRL